MAHKTPRKKKKRIKKNKLKEKEIQTQSESFSEDTPLLTSSGFEKNKEQEAIIVDEGTPSFTISPNTSSPLKFHIFTILLIAGVAYLAYSNTFQSPFTLDDDHNILSNPYVQIDNLSFAELSQAATKSPNRRRWLPNISFAVNYYFDKYDEWGYHLINLIIHILNGITLYFLAKITISKSVGATPQVPSKEIALLTALLWTLHPVQTNAVTYIVQRMTSMETLFFLLSMLCYVYGRKEHQRTLGKSLLFLMCLLFGLMAIFSKENAVMLPFMIIGYEIFFLQEMNFTHNLKKIVLFIVAPVSSIVLFGYIFSRGNFFGMFNYSLRDFSLTERLLTEPRVIFHYISLLFFPLPQRLNLDYDFIVSTGIFSPPQTILALIGISFLCFLPVIYFRHNRLIAYAVFWFLGNLFMESTFIPLEIIFEHRLYLPSMFLFMTFAASIYCAPFLKLKTARIILIIISIILGVFTWQRNMTWRTPISLWEDIVIKSPNKGRGYIGLGRAYVNDGQIDKGMQYYIKAEEMVNSSSDVSDLSDMYRNLGWAYIKKGDWIGAIRALEKGVALNPNDPKIHLNLGIAYKKINEMGKANFHFQYARRLNSKMFAWYL
jgi:hypothetical protein